MDSPTQKSILSARTSPLPRLLIACAAIALAAGACGPADTPGACESGVVAGDLVITEILANPEGEDRGQEWFEVFNATNQQIDLAGLELIASRADGTNPRSHVITGLLVNPGEYVVFGGIADDIRPAHVSYGFGGDLSTLVNSEGRIALQCGEEIIDETTYAESTSGAALQLDGNGQPDYLLNDERERWCDAQTEFAPGNLGTPGEENEACGVLVPGQCEDDGDGGVLRDVESPTPGDLVITEFMANPSAVADADGEWFEVFVARDVDLNGVGAGADPAAPSSFVQGEDNACVRVRAGSLVVFARDLDPAINGGLPQADFAFTFGLTNGDGTLGLAIGPVVLDQIAWSGSTAGASTALDPDEFTPEQNDDPINFCVNDTDVYGAGDTGTPGADNPQCPNVVLPGMCDDGGVVRPIVSPAPGEAVITEFMPNPAAVADSAGEWFEVRFDTDVDLNELELGRTPGTIEATVQGAACIAVTAGTYAVFARSDDPAVNGGLPRVAATFGFSLNNTSSGIFIGAGGTVIDAVTYAASGTGASTSIDEVTGASCPGTEVYGLGDLGTPGATNPACPSPRQPAPSR